MRSWDERLRRPPGEVRDVVFAATEKLLGDVSVSDLTVKNIIDEAQVSRSTFYAHFTSKYEVIGALLDQLIIEFDEALAPWFTSEHDDPEPALRDSLTTVAQLWHRHPIMRAAAETWHAVPELGSRWIAMMNHYVDTIAARIDDLRRRGLAPAGADSMAIAQVLGWGGAQMHYVASRNLYGTSEEFDALDGLLALWMGAIYQRTPAPAGIVPRSVGA
jgi:TetR/AcrR family transcriptional regulator, ethionamide resistance regulator